MAIKRVKEINRKGKAHKVVEIRECEYEVTSATSGKAYRVTLWADRNSCTCKWGKYNHNSACSHVQAVYEWLANLEGRTTSAWGSVEEAKRQHKKIANLGNGVVLTARKA